MRRLLLVLGLLSVARAPASAIDFYVAPDVPADLAGVGGGTALPWTVARHDTPFSYTTTLAQPLPLPFNAVPDALHLRNDGDWLFSVDAPTELMGTTYLPFDVVQWDGGVYTAFFCGEAFGLPAGTDVDAVLLLGQRDDGDLVLSFEAPTTIGGVTYRPADLVALAFTGPSCGDWIVAGLFFDSTATVPPVPDGVNVIAADERAGMPVLSFDVPATLGPTFLPGELVAWDATLPAFVSVHADPAWPIGARANAVSLLAVPGRIPGIEPQQLELGKGPGVGQITLFWSSSCSAGAEGYGIYEGALGSWYSHAAIDCADDGSPLEEVVNPAPGSSYYLVVPHNPNDEGSYGLDRPLPPGIATERPQGAPACRATQELGCP